MLTDASARGSFEGWNSAACNSAGENSTGAAAGSDAGVPARNSATVGALGGRTRHDRSGTAQPSTAQHCVRLSPAVSTATGLGILAFAAGASWGSLLLVVEGRVIPGRGVCAALLVVSLTLRWALTRVDRPTSASRLPRNRARWARLGSRLLIVTAVLGTFVGSGGRPDLGRGVPRTAPAGAGGCTAVVREKSSRRRRGRRPRLRARRGCLRAVSGPYEVTQRQPTTTEAPGLRTGRSRGLLEPRWSAGAVMSWTGVC